MPSSPGTPSTCPPTQCTCHAHRLLPAAGTGGDRWGHRCHRFTAIGSREQHMGLLESASASPEMRSHLFGSAPESASAALAMQVATSKLRPPLQVATSKARPLLLDHCSTMGAEVPLPIGAVMDTSTGAVLFASPEQARTYFQAKLWARAWPGQDTSTRTRRQQGQDTSTGSSLAWPGHVSSF